MQGLVSARVLVLLVTLLMVIQALGGCDLLAPLMTPLMTCIGRQLCPGTQATGVLYISNPGLDHYQHLCWHCMITQRHDETLVLAIPGNFALTLTGSTIPIGGNITNLSLPLVGGETVLVWKGNGYYAYNYQGAGVGTGLGFASDYTDGNPGTGAAIPGTTYDSANDLYWTPPINVNVAGGFFISNPGSTLTWKQALP